MEYHLINVINVKLNSIYKTHYYICIIIIIIIIINNNNNNKWLFVH